MSFIIIFFVFVFIMNIGYVMLDDKTKANIAVEEESKEVVLDPLADHTFVALLDIVFTDGKKRTCTGTIIHETVVLTAAHCFTNPNNEIAKPELLASFVVIGTKKMFNTGYEHYLPIEKILIHPKYGGWTADLALVYTFASMTGHKPGSVLPLAGERTSTHVDANVTVFSWGPAEIIEENWKNNHESNCESEEDCGKHQFRANRVSGFQTIMSNNWKLGEKDSQESATVFKSRDDPKGMSSALRSGPASMREQKAKRYLGIDEEMINSLTTDDDLGETLQSNEEIIIDGDFVTEPAFLADDAASSKPEIKKKKPSKKNLPKSAYVNIGKSDQIADDELETPYINRRSRQRPQSIYVNSRRFAETQNEQIQEDPYNALIKFDKSFKGWSIYRKPEETLQSTLDSVDIKAHFTNWRRHMGRQQNQLKVEIFGFVNQKLCESMVEKEMSAEFHLGNKNDVVCFSADDQFITDDDAGASVVRRGKLIAVAIGGVRQENAHVAIGMKMSCYCSWIAENLPEPRPDISCCYNCCEVTHLKDGVLPPQPKHEAKPKIISF